MSEVVKDNFLSPTLVKIAPCLKSDFDALLKLTVNAEPPGIPVCPLWQLSIYVIVDASSTGYGTRIWTHGKKTGSS